jgi:hypothetical protein
MTADEIRAIAVPDREFGQPASELQVVAVTLMREIAAQLAELNANTRAGMPDANMPDECRARECTYYKHYLAYGPADLTHEGFHAAEQNGLEHVKDCSRAAKGDNCTVCASYERRLRA